MKTFYTALFLLIFTSSIFAGEMDIIELDVDECGVIVNMDPNTMIENKFGENYFSMERKGSAASCEKSNIFTFYYMVKESEDSEYKDIEFKYDKSTRKITLLDENN